MKTRTFCIKNKNDYSLYWNNDLGWVEKEHRDIFFESEKHFLNLPLEGFWVFEGWV